MILLNSGKLLLLVSLLFFLGCTGTYSSRDGDGDNKETEVYPISMEDALLIMEGAMQKEFAEDHIEDIFEPHRGYQAKLRFLIDIDVISVYAVEGQGRGPGGEVVDGLFFEVHRSGTYPVGGIPVAKSVLKHTVEGASRIAEALQSLSSPD